VRDLLALLTDTNMAAQPQLINLDNYRPNELQELHNNVAQELQLLSGNLGTLKLALSKYKQSKEALTILRMTQNESTYLFSFPNLF